MVPHTRQTHSDGDARNPPRQLRMDSTHLTHVVAHGGQQEAEDEESVRWIHM